MIVLPSNYSTNFSAGDPVLYVVRLPDSPALTFASRSGLTIKYDSTTVSDVNTNFFAVRVDGQAVEYIGEIDCSIDLSRGGAIAGMNETSLIFLNQGRFDQFVKSIDLEKRVIEIYEGYVADGGTIDILDDMVQIFDGVIQDADQWDYRTYQIPCVDRRTADDRLIPKTLIYDVNFPDAPEDNIRKPIPFVAYGISGIDYNSKEKIFLPTVQTNKTQSSESTPIYFRIADDDFDCTKVVYADEDLYGEFQNITFWKTDTETYFSIEDGECDIFIRPTAALIGSTAGLEIDNTIDGDIDTTLLIDNGESFWFKVHDKSSSPGRITQDAFYMGDYGGPPATARYTDVVFYIYVDTISGTPVFSYLIGDDVADAVPILLAYNVTDDTYVTTGEIEAGHWYYIGGMLNITESEFFNLYNVRIGIECDGSSSIEISEIYYKVKANIEAFNQLTPMINYSGFDLTRTPPRGWKFNLPALKTTIYPTTKVFDLGNTIFCDGINDDDCTSPIPSNVIESILVAQCGLSSSDIDNTDANTARSDWYCQFSLTHRTRAMDIIGQICFEHSLGLWIDLSGIYRIFALDTGTTVYTIDDGDIALDGAGIPRILISKTTIRNIINDIHMSYGFSHVYRKHMKNVYIADTDASGTLITNLTDETGALIATNYTDYLEASIAKYRVRNTAEYNFDTIIDTATAEKAIKKLADWTAYKRMVIKLDVIKNTDTLTLRIGDIVALDSPLILGLIRSHVKYLVTGINFPPVGFNVQPYITLTLTEIPSKYMDIKPPYMAEGLDYVTGVT